MLYLAIDGIDDKLQVNKPTGLTEFEFDFKIDAREDWHQIANFGGKIINFSSNTLNVVYHADFKEVYVNGNLVASGTPFVPIGQRVVMRGILKDGITTGTTGSTFFSNTITQFLKGSIYDLKLYQLGVLAAHYDMSTGTLQDQTGNGNTVILTGGAWVDDAAPVGTDVSYSYATKQAIHADRETEAATLQAVTANRTVAATARQDLYANRTYTAAIEQRAYNERTVDALTTQRLYAERFYVPPFLIKLIDSDAPSYEQIIPIIVRIRRRIKVDAQITRNVPIDVTIARIKKFTIRM